MKPITQIEITSVAQAEMLFDVGSLSAHLHQVTDPRDPRGVRYGLVDLLTHLRQAEPRQGV